MVRKGIPTVPVARSTSSVRNERKEQPAPSEPRGEVPDATPSDTLLATWTSVFPLSHGPSHRVRLHTGSNGSAELVGAIAADYVRELSDRVPIGYRISADGDLRGPRDLDRPPRDVLFAAVFTTDLDKIVRRHPPLEQARRYPQRERPSPASRSTTD
jgi:hypothetical protein